MKECTAGGDVNKNSNELDLILLLLKIKLLSIKSGVLLNIRLLLLILFSKP